jgi:phosphatidylglycerophosphate synthase
MADIERHTRVNQTLTAPLERPALQWLAARSPRWITPDVLTALGVLGSVMCFVGYWLTHQSAWWLWFVNVGFALNWYGDSLDGTLARFRKIERPKFGFYIDHTVDVISEFLVIVGIGMSPYMRFDIGLFALIGYLVLSVHVYVRTAVDGVFKISYAALGPTELRLIIMITNTLIFFAQDFFMTPLLGDFLPFDLIGIALATALSLAFLISSWHHGVRIAQAEAQARK